MSLLAIALRLNVIHYSLWLDEAWVADSILSPTWRGMFYYDRWVQTTPPLFLALVRAASSLGVSEVSLRAVPLICGLLSLLVMAVALRRLFSPSLALLGATFLAGSYYAAKYSQEVKQYSADLLVSCLFLFLIWIWLESESSNRIYWALATLGTLGIFLSYVTLFWYPLVLLVAVHKLRRRPLRLMLLTALYAGATAAVLVLFVYPNRAPNLLHQWQNAFWGQGGVLLSSELFLQNLSQLWIPHQQQWWLIVPAYVFGILCGLGWLRSVVQFRQGEKRARYMLCLSIPIAAALCASALGQYPVLEYPRFILWMLPICIALAVYGFELIWARISQRIPGVLLPIACVLYLMANVTFLRKNPPSPEQVREAAIFLNAHVAPQDAVFVSGADWQQFSFYSQLLRWSPTNLYVANTWWPCCSRNKALVVSDPLPNSLQQDLHSFVLRSGSGTAWLLFPTGNDPAFWTYSLRNEIQAIPQLMRGESCRPLRQAEFRNARVYAFACEKIKTATRFKNLY
jgi:hypothetical protein